MLEIVSQKEYKQTYDKYDIFTHPLFSMTNFSISLIVAGPLNVATFGDP